MCRLDSAEPQLAVPECILGYWNRRLMLLEADRSLLLLVDAQTRLAPAIHDADACVERCRLLIEAARRLAVPVVATEQYPEGLGPTVPALADLLKPAEVHAKRHFSCAGEAQIVAVLEACARPSIVMCGMEAHICVLQSALRLKALGFAPVVVADAVASRRPASREIALQRMRSHGIEIVTAEMVVYEWLREAGTPAFRAILPLVR
jgi:nicotinamidase-related amidase